MSPPHKPHALNVLGPFYVEDECCTACGLPQHIAPRLFGEDAEDHCYVKQQPQTIDETDAMFETMVSQDLGCVRYRGDDLMFLRRLVEAGEATLCDAPLPPELEALIDVPSSIDLRDPRDAKKWAKEAEVTRPWRRELRQQIAELLHDNLPEPLRVLELGPGPGLLAETIFRTCIVERYTMLDFSPPFLDMCRARLGSNPAAQFVLGSFKHRDWPRLVEPPFDAIVAMQSVHEIRHKRHVPSLYAQCFELLRPRGLMVICDHEPPNTSPRMTSLHSTEDEQHAALDAARFERVVTNVKTNGMYVCSGVRP